MEKNHSLFALSPLDGRYADKVAGLGNYFSEAALIKYRLRMEVCYFFELLKFIKPEAEIPSEKKLKLERLWKDLTDEQLLEIKSIEQKTNHDIKAVEYFLRSYFDHLGLPEYREWIHFGLTSEDINNTAYSMMIKDSLGNVLKPVFSRLLKLMAELTSKSAEIPMLARTHGQPASPTTLGKELGVFLNRLLNELEIFSKLEINAKINGATGNYNAFISAFPEKDWQQFSYEFLAGLGLKQNCLTTQIEPHDSYAALFDSLSRINSIIINLDRDIWHYISLNYFVLERKKEEVGSSTMPHKVNPIDFENSEGNLELANSLLEFMKNKLTKSRLQRDLSDSTVLRNIGVAFGHSLLAYQSLLRGLNKIQPNKEAIIADLDIHPEVLAEAYQTVLRANGVVSSYDLLKNLTRGEQLDMESLHRWINSLEIPEELKDRLFSIKTEDYTGMARKLSLQVTERAEEFLKKWSK